MLSVNEVTRSRGLPSTMVAFDRWQAKWVAVGAPACPPPRVLRAPPPSSSVSTRRHREQAHPGQRSDVHAGGEKAEEQHGESWKPKKQRQREQETQDHREEAGTCHGGARLVAYPPPEWCADRHRPRCLGPAVRERASDRC